MPQAYYLLKKKLQHRYFPMNYPKFLYNKSTYFVMHVQSAASGNGYTKKTRIIFKYLLTFQILNTFEIPTYPQIAWRNQGISYKRDELAPQFH